MRRTLASLSVMAALLAGATAGEAADSTIDPTHSHILFTIDHLGFARMVGLFSASLVAMSPSMPTMSLPAR